MKRIKKELNDLKNLSVGLLKEGKTIRIKAHGYSMHPTIKQGTVIIIEPLGKTGPPGEGEIVAIKRESGIIVHRVVKIISEDGVRKYIARGDSNAYADPAVGAEMIVGRVTGVDSLTVMPDSFRRRPNYFLNRLRVIGLNIRNRLKG